MKRRFFAALATLGIASLGLSTAIFTPLGAHAAPTPLDETNGAKGRSEGSGKWGYIGQFGQVNRTDRPGQGQFFFPYGIDIDGDQIAVVDSGRASWESGNKVAGHSLQTFTRVNYPGSAGHGDYLGGGEYDVINTKQSSFDPADIIEPIALDYYETDTPRGPRGVTFGPEGSLFSSSYESSNPDLRIRAYSDASLQDPTLWGSGEWASPGPLHLPVGIDTDSQGNVYIGTGSGVMVYSAAGEFLTGVSVNFDENGEDQNSAITWGNRMSTVPQEYVKPNRIGETYGLSVIEQNGQVAVYVGDAGSYYEADGSVHFQNGSTAEGTKPASIKKYIVKTSGGPVSERWNPQGWKWELDTSFGTEGAVQFAGNSLSRLLGRYIFTPQTVFALEADPASNSLYFSLNGVAGQKGIGVLDMNSGELKDALHEIKSPSATQDSAGDYVRGIAVDDRGLVYATTQGSTTTTTQRAVVQIWGMTPTSIAGTASVVTSPDSAVLSWGESSEGYQQPDLLDYVVKYRKVGDADWLLASPPDDAATSLDLSREIPGLYPATEYEARITPFNEAGSGDPAVITWTTPAAAPAIEVVKTGNGELAPTPEEAISLPAGSEVTFSYTVTNTGNVPVTISSLVDSDPEIGNVPLEDPNYSLAPGEDLILTAGGSVDMGEYHNTVIVTGSYDGQEIEASADWYGFGVSSGITIEKRGNGSLAPTPEEAISLPADSEVTFTYTITNTGNTSITQLNVTDSVLGEIELPADFAGTLHPGDSLTIEASGTIAEGEYVNTATVTGIEVALGTSVEDTMQWHGIGKVEPTEGPTEDPTEDPTQQPTEGPTEAPTEDPTQQPTGDSTTEVPVDSISPAPSGAAPTETGPADSALSGTGIDPLLITAIIGATITIGIGALIVRRSRLNNQQ